MSAFTNGQKVVFSVRNPRTGATTELTGVVSNENAERGRIEVQSDGKTFRPFAKQTRAA